MHESLLVITGIIFGTVSSLSGVLLGAKLVKRTYMELTTPLSDIYIDEEDTHKDKELRDNEAYDWSEYDQYIKGATDDDDGVPEA